MEDAQAQHSRSGKPLWSNRIISYNRLHVISLHRALASSLHTFLSWLSFWWYKKIIQLRNSRAICRICWLTPKSAAAAHFTFISHQKLLLHAARTQQCLDQLYSENSTRDEESLAAESWWFDSQLMPSVAVPWWRAEFSYMLTMYTHIMRCCRA